MIVCIASCVQKLLLFVLFLMEVLRLHDDKKITIDDVLKVLLITENYLFRRNICDVPTNALNKIFFKFE